ncbi:MAG: glycosyltransferase [Pseudohongiellaceae bacterium]
MNSEKEIVAEWRGDIDKPLLSICCIAYNHEKFIESAIRGFLIQKTSFPFEIYIHDDASTDTTAEIISSYAEKYPRIIKPILQAENQYRNGNKPWIILNKYLLGKYVAVCEGDDYWVDPLKLQKQVTFLEENLEYVISGHDACIVTQDGKLIAKSKSSEMHKRDFEASELLYGKASLLTLSWVYRRGLVDDEAIAERSVVKNGDTFFLSLMGQHGKSHYHEDIKSAVYRRHAGGVWGMLEKSERKRANITTWLMISNYYKRIGREDVAENFWRHFKSSALSSYSIWELVKELIIRTGQARKMRNALRRVGRLLTSE